MVVRTGSAAGTVPAASDAVSAAPVDIDRLPRWNAAIKRVTDHPAVLEPGAEWVVEVRPPGMPAWASRSTLIELDAGARRFRYRSATDDGNPSFAIWDWQVADAPGGSRVTVSWELHPETFVRRVLLSRVRHRAPRDEARRSIEAIGAMIASETG